MDRGELEALLAELRILRTDHQWVEAKAARRALPDTTWETVSAFANTDGGLLLLGVDEGDGAFEIVGVEDPPRVQAALEGLCAEMVPPLRPRLDQIICGDGRIVIAADIPPVAVRDRPCHRRSRGPYESFSRVGDADQQLSRAEVDEMQAARSGGDYSRRPAPDGAALDRVRVEDFLGRVRAEGVPDDATPDEVLLERWGATREGHPTIAGMLALGENPQGVAAAARLTYRQQPGPADPPGARHRARHFEGRVDELLESTLRRLERDLETIQIEEEGRVINESDVPRLALREIVSNALIHRSLAPGSDGRSVLVEVSTDAVVVLSPGGISPGTDPSQLGIGPIANARNLSLVRICEHLETGDGLRVVEHQAAGIPRADRICHLRNTMPPLFVDLPAEFEAILIRGAIDPRWSHSRLEQAGLEPSPSRTRLLAVAHRLHELRAATPGVALGRVVLDARLAARALAPCTIEDAAVVLHELERARLLVRRRVRTALATWDISESPPSEEPVGEGAGRGRSRVDRLPDLLRAIASSPSGELRFGEIGSALGLSSPTSTNRWIRRALERGFVFATSPNDFAPKRAYRLTAAGEEFLRNQRRSTWAGAETGRGSTTIETMVRSTKRTKKSTRAK